VLLVPTGTPPHKEVDDEPGAAVRLELCRAAVGEDSRLGVSDVEVGRAGPSYTVDTLRLLRERDPGDELTFIVGADMARSLATWREPREVLRLAQLAVAGRGEAGREEVDRDLVGLDAGDRVVHFAMPRVDISSSALRERAAQGRSLRYWVPEAVRHEIEVRGLYRHGGAARAAREEATA
jgi:nicotinate-nucleotide adenylyltransferase